MSVIDHVDKMLIWDTGSTDNTVKIIKEIKRKYPNKVSFKQVGDIDINDFTDVRQKMLNATDSDWLFILDGDEIWWQESIEKAIQKISGISGREIESIVTYSYNLVGDIFHYQDESAGMYRIAGRKGHLALRFINRKIPGLASNKPHGTWGWVDGKGKMIQDRSSSKIAFINAPYLHATFLPRAGNQEKDFEVPKRSHKLKYELGNSFPKDFYYPEVFFRPRPKIVSSPWFTMSSSFRLNSLIQTPMKKLKRRIWKSQTGY